MQNKDLNCHNVSAVEFEQNVLMIAQVRILGAKIQIFLNEKLS